MELPEHWLSTFLISVLESQAVQQSKKKKKKKQQTHLQDEGRIKTVLNYREHDDLCRKSDGLKKNSTVLNI